MIVVMKAGATEQEVEAVISRIKELGFNPHVSQGVERCVIGCIGDERTKPRLQSLEAMAGVENIVPILKPYKLASRQVKMARTVLNVDGVQIGGDQVVVAAGPCSVESEDQLLRTAVAVKEAGATVLRGGAFKPRTSPYEFQGMGEKGLKLLAKAREVTGLAIVTEVMSDKDVALVASYADVLQIGARNMQNFALLKSLGTCGRAVLLKRGMSSTVRELLMSAEYIVAGGNPNVMLCERGIRTFETVTRNTCDIASVAALNELTHLPIILDPSHATGKRSLVPALSRAGVAIGADGLIVEVHPCPEKAFSDGAQSLEIAQFRRMMADRGAASVSTAALADKTRRRVTAVPIEYRGFEVGDEFLIGYGLDWQGHYRNLRSVWAVLDMEALIDDPRVVLGQV